MMHVTCSVGRLCSVPMVCLHVSNERCKQRHSGMRPCRMEKKRQTSALAWGNHIILAIGNRGSEEGHRTSGTYGTGRWLTDEGHPAEEEGKVVLIALFTYITTYISITLSIC